VRTWAIGSKGTSTQTQAQNQTQQAQQYNQQQAQQYGQQQSQQAAQQQAQQQGQTTNQQAQQGTSTYGPNAQIGAAGLQALTQAQQAAQSPFQLPVAPVAGFTPDQMQAFLQTQQQQGFAQPYFNQAQGLFNQSAAPISSSQINQYLNPYAANVMANLQESQGQQMQDLTGRATQAAGGVGADRIGVAQGELARQQNLATGQTLSGIYGSALSAAQQDAQRQQASAYGIGNLGGAAQNAAMQGTQALAGQGSLQQQLAQAQMNAPYQNTLARLSLPYQQAQFLSGITGGLAPSMGGTTTTNQAGTSLGTNLGTSSGTSSGTASGTNFGQSSGTNLGQMFGTSMGTGYGTATPAQPSIFSQIAGAGTAGIGALGATGAFGDNGYLSGLGKGSNPSYGSGNNVYGGSSTNPLSGLTSADYGTGYADGGDVAGIEGDQGWLKSDPTIPVQSMQASPVNQPRAPSPLDLRAEPVITPPTPQMASAKPMEPVTTAPMPAMSFKPIPPMSMPQSGSSSGSSSFLGDIAKTVTALAPLLALAQGGAVGTTPYQAFDDGGDVSDEDRARAYGLLKLASGQGTRAYTDSPVGNSGSGRNAAEFANAFSPASAMSQSPEDYRVGSPFNPYRESPPANLKMNPDADIPNRQLRVNAVAQPAEASEPTYPGFGGSKAAAETGVANLASMRGLRANVPYSDLDPTHDVSRGFAKSPWLALINAGAGMMGGTSPYAGVNIGKGLQAGVETLGKQREASREEESVNQRAQQLALTAQQHLDTMTKMTPYQAAQTEQAQSVLEAGNRQKLYENPIDGTSIWLNRSTGK